jgi:hypothetical protein
MADTIIPRSQTTSDALIGFHGAAVHWNVFRTLYERVERASEVARQIDARQRKRSGNKKNASRSPILRLAGMISGINKYLDHEHGNSAYVDDVRYPASSSRLNTRSSKTTRGLTVPMAPPADSDASDLPGENGFALRVSNLQMVDDGGPVSFPLNAIIIVDSDRGAKPGDFVLVSEVGAREPFFKAPRFRRRELFSLCAQSPASAETAIGGRQNRRRRDACPASGDARSIGLKRHSGGDGPCLSKI